MNRRDTFTLAARGCAAVTTAILWNATLNTAHATGPVPVGSAAVTISYDTTSGPVSFSGDRDFQGDATGPSNATVLADAPNIRAFNAVNSFGRRTALANSNPIFDGVLGENESLLAHAFFKNVPTDIGQDFFPDLVQDGTVTINIASINFDAPANIDPSTIMIHALWNADQVDQLSSPYLNTHNHHTASDPFRDFSEFLSGGIFSDFPTANYVLGDINPTVTGNGTTSLGINVEFPYAMLKNLEETGQTVPGGLPAPQGFLEPFHFHLEYVVTPEPSTLIIAATLLTLTPRRRRLRTELSRD